MMRTTVAGTQIVSDFTETFRHYLYFVRYAHVRFVLGQEVNLDVYNLSISRQKLLFWILIFVVFLRSSFTYGCTLLYMSMLLSSELRVGLT